MTLANKPTRIHHLWSFVVLTRPAFLLGGALLYALGAAMATASGAAIEWRRYALGQAIVTSTQLMTHYANEYFDREGDRAIGANRTFFTGGSGVLPDGRLPPEVALNAARVCAVMTCSMILITLAVEPAMSAIGLLALLGGWFYSAPPARLVASGFGEAITALIVAFLAPLSGVVMQRGLIDARLFAITLPLIFINVAMLIVFELPDYEADRQTGKRTLAIRLGCLRVGRLHDILLIAAFAVVWIATAANWIDWRIAVWTLVAVPVAAWQIVNMRRHARHGRRAYAILAAGGIGLFSMVAATMLAGFLSL